MFNITSNSNEHFALYRQSSRNGVMEVIGISLDYSNNISVYRGGQFHSMMKSEYPDKTTDPLHVTVKLTYSLCQVHFTPFAANLIDTDCIDRCGKSCFNVNRKKITPLFN